jgi:sugar lactone lactonase YvrE
VSILALWLGVVTAFAHPSSGIVADATGAVTFVDERRNIVFHLDPAGKLTQWLTNKHCHELYLDTDGNLFGEHQEYLGEAAGWRSSIWRRDRAGKVTDVYGPAPGFPPGLLQDAQGYRYQGNANDNPNGPVALIQRRAPDGKFTVLAGGPRGQRDGRGDQARLNDVLAMAWGPERNLYFLEADAVRRVTLEGVVTTLARGFRGEADPDLPTQRLWGLTVNPAREVFVADYGNRRVVKVTSAGKVTTVLQSEKPWSPAGVALAGETLFVLEHGFERPVTALGPRVRKLSPGGQAATLVTITDQLVEQTRGK